MKYYLIVESGVFPLRNPNTPKYRTRHEKFQVRATRD